MRFESNPIQVVEDRRTQDRQLRERLPWRPRIALALAIGLAIVCSTSPARAADPAPLIIFHADSLTAYVSTLARRFEAAHPGVVVEREGSGSLDMVRKVSDLGLPCDIVIAADARLLATPHRGIEPWEMLFAGNAMGILYTADSRGAGSIDAHNWYRVLLSGGVRYGHSNPERDPAGYYTLLVWRLAERYYGEAGLAARLAAGCPAANIRPHDIDLIALLQSGELDYYFGYASDARLGNLRFLALAPQINLADIARPAEYARASVEIGTGEHRRTIRGAPIAYAASLASGARHRRAAIAFLELMAGKAGRAAAAGAGLIAYPSALARDPQNRMPTELRALAKPFGG
jgi:molybdate/tungstate transport system substrate-binding protein